jgi:peptidoglycan-associated lipoprotein
MNVVSIIRGAKFAAVILAGLMIAGCAKQPVDETGANGTAATPGSQQDFVVNVGDRVFFETDSTELTEQARGTLDKQAQWLSNYNRYSFTIEGHADERGTREYNIALGARRAQTVREYLVSRGIAANRMRTISYGKERPVAVCDDISCWS